jgi:hypothetical protein
MEYNSRKEIKSTQGNAAGKSNETVEERSKNNGQVKKNRKSGKWR